MKNYYKTLLSFYSEDKPVLKSFKEYMDGYVNRSKSSFEHDFKLWDTSIVIFNNHLDLYTSSREKYWFDKLMSFLRDECPEFQKLEYSFNSEKVENDYPGL